MKNPRVDYSAGKEIPNKSFSETARGLLVWQRDGFEDIEPGEKGIEGRDVIKKLFVPQKNSEDGPDRMIRILDFLTSKMNVNDGGKLRAVLNELKGGGSVSVLPTNKKSPPSDILRKLLLGGYDENIDVSGIASRGQTYALALYLYMHTSGDSEEEMVRVLVNLIKNYDDPRASRYDYGIEGLEAAPLLAQLCTEAIEKHGLGQSVRNKTRGTLNRTESGNLQEVTPSSDSIPPSI